MAENEKDFVRELHNGWVRANYVADTDWLEKNVAPGGPGAFVFYNSAGSNFYGLTETVDLWKRLREAAVKSNPKGGRAHFDDFDVRVRVNGDIAWVTYRANFEADMGEYGKVSTASRGTEIWERSDDEWRLVHLHASEHKPGKLGGE